MNVPPQIARQGMIGLGMYLYPKKKNSASPFYRPYPHVQKIEKAWRRLKDPNDPAQRLLVAMPPRHGKTMSVMELIPTDFLLNNPWCNVLGVSYSGDVPVKKGSALVRNHMKLADELYPDKKISVDRSFSAKQEWSLVGHGGGMKCQGLHSGITGHGANLMVFDDPYKNYQEAHSPTIQDNVHKEYVATVQSRLNWPYKIFILNATRWARQDLSGTILSQYKASLGATNPIIDTDQWIILEFPAIAVEDEYNDEGKLTRRKGEALCPDILSVEELLAIEKQDSYVFEAVYQQRPKIPGTVQWAEHYFENVFIDCWPREQVTNYVISLDPQHKKGAVKGSKTAAVALGFNRRTMNRGYVESDIRNASPVETVDNMVEFAQRMRTVTGKWADFMIVEDRGMQSMILETAEKPLRDLGCDSEFIGYLPPKELDNKDLRIVSMDPSVKEEWFAFSRTPSNIVLVDQFKLFGMDAKGLQKDGLDSLEIGCSATRMLIESGRL